MRERVYINLDSEVLKELKKIKSEIGLPISRQLENSWKKQKLEGI